MALTKITFEDLPSENTPINASNLNAVQDNVDTEITATKIALENEIQGIVESGSNANGRYVKFDDGTMICTMSVSVTNQAINNAYGSLYIGGYAWYFPVPFYTVENLSVTCSQFRWGSGASWGNVMSFGTTYANLRGFDVLSRSTGTACEISAMAIGRWK